MIRQLVYLVALVTYLTTSLGLEIVSDEDDEVELPTAELIARRGYKAISYHVATSEGYIIEVVRAINPKLEGTNISKGPILFIHGIQTTANCFIVNSAGVEPKNYAHLKVNQLNRLIESDPASNSLVFMALNFGYDIWLLNRRGTRRSLGHTDPERQAFQDDGDPTNRENLDEVTKLLASLGLTSLLEYELEHESNSFIKLTDLLSFGSDPDLEESIKSRIFANYTKLEYNPRYWNYSLDEQARYDVPQVVDFIIKKTGHKKVSLVGHSAGGALIIMAMLSKRNFEQKVAKAILWAPSMDMGDTTNTHPFATPFTALEETLFKYRGPFPPAPLAALIKQITFSLCRHELAQHTICRIFDDIAFGPGGYQQNLSPAISTTFFDTVSSHEVVSILQSIRGGSMIRLDHRDSIKNRSFYGSDEAPQYDMSKINFKDFHVYYGNNDIIVTPRNVERTMSKLNVSLKSTFLNHTGVSFNHASFFTHHDVGRLLVIPSLRDLESR